MASGRTHLTQAIARDAKAPASGQLFIRDTQQIGLALRVTEGGARSWTFEANIHGQPRRMTLGRWPGMSCAMARRKAAKLRADIAAGHDPAEERQAERREMTLGDLMHSWFDRYGNGHLKASSLKHNHALVKYLPSAWMRRRLSSFARGEFERLHANLGASNGRYAANQVMRLMRSAFNKAPGWGANFAANPASGFPLYREQKRDRFLAPDEVRRLSQALANEPDWRWQAFFPLALMLGCRKNELLGLRWHDVDFGQKTIHLGETKSGAPLLLPLPETALSILEGLPSRDVSEWIFPGIGRTGHLTEVNKAWTRLCKVAAVPDARVHDIRRTLGSWMAGSGTGLPLIGRVLNHASPATTAIYARLALDSVRIALERHSQALLEAGMGVPEGERETPGGGGVVRAVDEPGRPLFADPEIKEPDRPRRGGVVERDAQGRPI
jgi:integrase